MEDLGKRTLKELMTLARERFGAGASSLKTRSELVTALSAGTAPPTPAETRRDPDPAVVELVTADFFRRRGA